MNLPGVKFLAEKYAKKLNYTLAQAKKTAGFIALLQNNDYFCSR
jgi:hypothetical protein